VIFYVQSHLAITPLKNFAAFFLALFLAFLALSTQAQTLVGTYPALQTAAGAGGANDIRLSADINGATQLTIAHTLTLDLNGHALTIALNAPTGATANGIKINPGVTLTITDSSLPSVGTLTVTNGANILNSPAANSNFGAAINSSEGALSINSGTVTARGGSSGAGIGGGRNGAGGVITINGGTVNADGDGGAGIGGGYNGDGGVITISDGEVKARSLNLGAGIGGGMEGAGGVITISGGTVNADGDGAGIGGGYLGAGGTITISGGTITAIGTDVGAGIGGGGGGLLNTSGTIEIIGTATVTAIGGDDAWYATNRSGAGIGSGGTGLAAASVAVVESITINTTGTVTAIGGPAVPGNATGAGAAIGQGGHIGGDGAGIASFAHPSPQTVNAGQTAAFAFVLTEAAGGLPAAAYQWQVFTGGVFADVTDGAGGTTSNYTTIPTTLAMSGHQYRNVMTASDVNGDGTGKITITSHSALLTVGMASPTLALAASPAGSMTLPGSVTLTVTLAGATDNSNQTITFIVDGVNVGAEMTDAVGVATYTFTPPNAGTHSFGAEFAGNADNNPASAAPVNGYVVNAASPTLALAASPAGSMTLPGSVTLTVTLAGATDNSNQTITFIVDGVNVGAEMTDAAGVATYTFTPPNAGTYSFGAEFAGDASNNAATAAGIGGYLVRPVPMSANLASIPALHPSMLVLLALVLGGMVFWRNRVGKA